MRGCEFESHQILPRKGFSPESLVSLSGEGFNGGIWLSPVQSCPNGENKCKEKKANFPASTDMQKAILYTVTAACAGYWSGFVRKEIERFLGTVPRPLS